MTGMAAGLIKYLACFTYAAQTSTPFVAGTQTYWPGIIPGDGWTGRFTSEAQWLSHWLANNADPMDTEYGKIPVNGALIGKVFPLYDIPFYLVLGKHDADTPSAGISQVKGTTDGSVPKLNWHVENNILPFEMAKEYATCYCTEAKIGTSAWRTAGGKKAAWLSLDMKFIAQHELDMTSNSIVQLTTLPKYRGTNAAVPGFRINGNTGITVTWNGLNIGAHLVDFKAEIQNDIEAILLNDNNYDAGVIVNNGIRTFTGPILKFSQFTSVADDFDKLCDYVDGTTCSDLVITIPKADGSATIKLAWKNVYLVQVLPDPSPSEVHKVRSLPRRSSRRSRERCSTTSSSASRYRPEISARKAPLISNAPPRTRRSSTSSLATIISRNGARQ